MKPSKPPDFFITGKEVDAHGIDYSRIAKKSQYSESVLKYPTCDISKMKKSEKEQINQLKEKYGYLLRVANQLKEVRSQTIGHYCTRMNEINALGEFFKDCIEAGKKLLLKEQELVKATQKSSGGTLQYELKKKKDGIKDLVRSARVEYMQDRHMKTVIYEVIKRIIATAKQQKKFEHISSIKLEWDVFKDMRSLDILALLLLRKDALEKLYANMFSHALTDSHNAQSIEPLPIERTEESSKRI